MGNTVAGSQAAVDSSVLTGLQVSTISDGTSNTIAVIEDAGRVSPTSSTNYYCLSTYLNNWQTNTALGTAELTTAHMLTGDVTGDATGNVVGQTAPGVWRWATRMPAEAAFPARSATRQPPPIMRPPATLARSSIRTLTRSVAFPSRTSLPRRARA